MKIALVGAGVGGAYLANRLQSKGHEVSVFESMRRDEHWPICAWGTSRHMLSTYSRKAGLEFDNYILHEGNRLKVKLPNEKIEYLKLDGLVTFDKRTWEIDLLRGVQVFYGVRCSKNSFLFRKYGLVIDCTGFHRALLPKPENDFFVLSYEYLIDNIHAEDDFFAICNKGATGYLWHFPLDKGRAFVGIGDTSRENLSLDSFLREFPHARIVKRIGRPVRLCPPKLMEPFFHGNIIGVGESIGCVFLTGEGIIPTLQCCDIFLHCLDSENSRFNFDSYRQEVLRTFSYYADAFLGWRLKAQGKLNLVRHINLLMRIYYNMKRQEKRFGFKVDLSQMIRIAKAF
jgi:flavin-dependent dehydrogenase